MCAPPFHERVQTLPRLGFRPELVASVASRLRRILAMLDARGRIVKRPSLGLMPPVVTFSAPQVSLGGAPCAVVRASDSALDFIAPALPLEPSSSARAHRSGQLFTSGAGARMRRWAVVGPDQRAWIDNRHEYPYDERVWTGAWRFRSGGAGPLQAVVAAVELESVLVPPQSGRSACLPCSS